MFEFLSPRDVETDFWQVARQNRGGRRLREKKGREEDSIEAKDAPLPGIGDVKRRLKQVASRLKSWAPQLMDESSAAPLANRQELEEMIQDLQLVDKLLILPNHKENIGKSRRRYRAMTLLACVLTGNMLK